MKIKIYLIMIILISQATSARASMDLPISLRPCQSESRTEVFFSRVLGGTIVRTTGVVCIQEQLPHPNPEVVSVLGETYLLFDPNEALQDITSDSSYSSSAQAQQPQQMNGVIYARGIKEIKKLKLNESASFDGKQYICQAQAN